MRKITIENLEKTFVGDGIRSEVLKNMTIHFNEGEFTSIIGPSGSGKSTLLSIIGTLDRPTAGVVSYDDVQISALSKQQLADFRYKQIGFIFQQFHLIPALTALENVLTPFIGRESVSNKKERGLEVLQMVGLKGKEMNLPSQLSGGQQQRVAIARAIINRPKWLLADEPTGNLDSENGEMIIDLLKELNEKEGCSIILVTHDLKFAQKTQRIVEMKDGQILSDRVNTYA